MGHISQGAGHLAYQLFLVFIGLAVATLSGTGAYLWYKGYKQRLKSRQKAAQKVVSTQANPMPYPQPPDGLDDAV